MLAAVGMYGLLTFSVTQRAGNGHANRAWRAATRNRAADHAGRVGAVALALTPDDLRDIDRAASQITVEGARYPEHMERMTGR